MSTERAPLEVEGRSAPAGALSLSAAVVDEVLTHARAERPIEACGLLSGNLSAGHATRYHAARNAAASPLRYDIDAEDLVRIVFEIERSGDDLVAIFHSHTRTPAIPSASDRREAAYPGLFYLIASLAEASVRPVSGLRAWRIHGTHTFEVPLRVE